MAGTDRNPLTSPHATDRVILVLVLATMSGLAPMCMDIYLPSLPAIALDLDVPASLAQASITSCLLGLAAGQLLIGPASDGTGRRPMLLASLAVFVASSLACSLTTSGPAFLALRFLQGLSGAGGVVLSRAVCGDTFRGAQLTGFFALLMAIQSLAPIVGPIVGGFLAGLAGWQANFWLLTAIGLLLAAASLHRLPETLPPEKRVTGGVRRSLANMLPLFRHRAFLCYVGIHGFTMACYFTYLAACPFVFQRIYDLTPGEFSLVFAVNAIGVGAASLLAGRLAPRVGNAPLMLLACIVRAAACLGVLALAIALPPSPLPLMAVLFVMIFTQGIVTPTSFSLGIGSQHTGTGAAAGILGVSTHFFGSFTSPLAGVMGPDSALPMGLVCAGTSLVALGLCLAVLPAARRQDAADRRAAESGPRN